MRFSGDQGYESKTTGLRLIVFVAAVFAIVSLTPTVQIGRHYLLVWLHLK